MKEQLEALFNGWINPKTRDAALLDQLYSEIKGVSVDNCPKCKSKAINELRKYYDKHFVNVEVVEPTGRKYVLKPGNHQFAPGDSYHNNDNTTDRALAQYLKLYPYIKPLFIKTP